MKKKESEYERILKTIKIAEKEIAEIEAREAKKKAGKLNDKERLNQQKTSQNFTNRIGLQIEAFFIIFVLWNYTPK